MATKDFDFEFYSEIPNLDAALITEAESQLRELMVGHTDIIGASVAVEELTGDSTPHRYEARVLVYVRPDNVVAVEKEETAELAVKGALDAAERQIRELRDKLREQSR